MQQGDLFDLYTVQQTMYIDRSGLCISWIVQRTHGYWLVYMMDQ